MVNQVAEPTERLHRWESGPATLHTGFSRNLLESRMS
jgi:hypothetical protein